MNTFFKIGGRLTAAAMLFVVLSLMLFAGQARASFSIDITGATATVSTVVAGQTAAVTVTPKTGTTIHNVIGAVVDASNQCNESVNSLTTSYAADTSSPFAIDVSLPADSAGKYLCVFYRTSLIGFPVVVFNEIIISGMPEKTLGIFADAGDRVVYLGWTPSNNSAVTVVQYQQKTGTAAYGSWIDIPGSSGYTGEYTVTGLTNGTVYKFKVRPVHRPSGSGITGLIAGPASDEVSATPITPPPTPSAIVLTSPSSSPGKDTTPTFTVTVGETGGRVGLWLTSDCLAGSSPLGFDGDSTVTDATPPYTVDVTAKALTEGTYTVYATHRKESSFSPCSTVSASYTLDTTAPTVTSGSTKYYSDAALSTELTNGSLRKGAENIYTKVVFSENMANTNNNGATARPSLWYTIGSSETQYDIVAHTATLASGECQAKSASDTSEYTCRYTTGSSDNGAFKLRVKTTTTDVAGNALAAQYDHADSITLDTTPPASPGTPDLTDASDTGSSNSDNVTSDNTPSFTVSSVTSGDTILVVATHTDTSSVSVEVTASGTTVTANFPSSKNLKDGQWEIDAYATDPAGNTSAPSSALTITVDRTDPSAPTTALTQDTGTVANYTANGEVTVGEVEANATWEYRVDTDGDTTDNLSTASWTAGTGTTIPESVFGSDGLKRAQVRQTDSAGNTSPASTLFVFTVDKTPPAAPTALNLVDADDSCADFDGTPGCDFGTNTDNITSQTTGLTIQVTGEEHATIQLKTVKLPSIKNAGSASAPLPSDGAGSIDISLSDGDDAYNIIATQTDRAGNTSPASSSLNITIDTAAPTAAPAPDLHADSDTGASSSDNRTNKPTVVFSTGTHTVASECRVVFEGTYAAASTNTCASASLTHDTKTYPHATTYTNTTQGEESFKTRAYDLAGNHTDSSATTVHFDRTDPSAPTTALTQDTGTTTHYTANGEVTIGSIEANATWEYRVDTDGDTTDNLSTASWTTGTGTTIAASVFGTDGLKRTQVRQTDPAGNTSPASTAFVFTVDKTPPPAAPTTALTQDTGTVANYTSNGEVTVGSIEANAAWEYRVDTDGDTTDNLSTASWTTGTGTTIAASVFGSDGLKRAQVRQTDSAGNTSPASTPLVFTVDDTDPVIGTVSDASTKAAAADGKKYLKAGDTVTVTVNITDGHALAPSVTLKFGDGSERVATTTGTESPFSFTYTVQSGDTGVLSYKITDVDDAAGNSAADQTTFTAIATVVGDTLAPTVTTADTKYYADAALSAEITSGTEKEAGDDIYTTVKFSENVVNTDNDSATARPSLWYVVSTTETQYDIVAHDAALASGDCQAKSATDTSEYTCFYTAAATDFGAFKLRVKTTTADLAGNTLAAQYNHADTITLNAPPGGASFVKPAQDTGASASDNLTNTFTAAKVTLPSGVTITDATSTLEVYTYDPETDDTCAAGTGLNTGWTARGTTTADTVGTDYPNDRNYDTTSREWVSAAFTQPPEGKYCLTARYDLDGAGARGISGYAAGTLVTLDTTAPGKPTADLADVSDTGSSDSDDITSDSTPTITVGSLTSGDVVVVTAVKSGETDVTAEAVATAATASILLGTLGADGDWSITVTATDAAGNASAASDTLTITLDTADPIIGTVIDASTKAAAANGTKYLTLGDTVTLTVPITDVSEVAPTVVLRFGTGTADRVMSTDSASSPFSFTYAIQSDDAGALKYKITDIDDQAGNSAADQTSYTTLKATHNGAQVDAIIADTVLPDPPTLALTTDTGSPDGFTSNGAVTVSGLEVDASWEYRIDNDGNAADNIATATWIAGSGSAIPESAFNADGSGGGDGLKRVQVRQTDLAQNTSATSTTFTYTLDETAPAKVTGLDLDAEDDTCADFNGTSGCDFGTNEDNITSQTTGLTIRMSGEQHATVQLKKSKDGTAATNAGSASSALPSGGAGSIDLSLSDGDGSYAITATQTDRAGNVSPASTALTITIDTAAPTAPAAPDLHADSDTGASSSDNLTNKPTVVFSTGTHTVTSECRVVFEGTYAAASTNTCAEESLAHDSKTYPHATTYTNTNEGIESFKTRVYDHAGNHTDSSATTVHFDRTVAEATLDLKAASDSGYSDTDNITRETTPAVTLASLESSTAPTDGTGQAKVTVNKWVDADNDSVIDSTELTEVGTIDNADAASKDLTLSDLGEGVHKLVTVHTDDAGNERMTALTKTAYDAADGTKGSNVIIVDTTPPQAPALPDLDPAQDSHGTYPNHAKSGTDYDNITYNQDLLFFTEAADRAAGDSSALTGAALEREQHHLLVYELDDADTATATATVITGQRVDGATHPNPADAASRSISSQRVFGRSVDSSTDRKIGQKHTHRFAAATADTEGTYYIAAKQKDAAGNLSAYSPALTVKIDRKKPNAVPGEITLHFDSATDLSQTSRRTANFAPVFISEFSRAMQLEQQSDDPDFQVDYYEVWRALLDDDFAADGDFAYPSSEDTVGQASFNLIDNTAGATDALNDLVSGDTLLDVYTEGVSVKVIEQMISRFDVYYGFKMVAVDVAGNIQQGVGQASLEISAPSRAILSYRPYGGGVIRYDFSQGTGAPYYVGQASTVLPPPPIRFESPLLQFTRNLTVGDRGEDVQQLQQYFNNNSCLVSEAGAGSPGRETTYFGTKTRQSAVCYQREHAINPPLGFVGPLTRAHINARLAALGDTALLTPTNPLIISTPTAQEKVIPEETVGPLFTPWSLSAPVSSAGTPPETTSYSVGDRHEDIREAQQILNKTPCTVATSGAGSAGQETDYFGQKTRQAILCYQQRNNLSQTGILTPALLALLRNE